MNTTGQAKEFEFVDGRRLPVGTMYCIGRNYAAHAREMNAELPPSPLVFLKPSHAYVAPGQAVQLPRFSSNVHHEVELVIVIGADADGSESDPMQCVAGYAVGIDLTARDVQSLAKQKGEPWTLSKAFKGSAPISRVVARTDFPDPDSVELALSVNGETRQRASTSLMERPVAELIRYIATTFGLAPGDCIFSGTPEGVAQLKSGDQVSISISKIIDLNIDIL